MKKRFSHNFFYTYTDTEWLFIKLSLAFFWLGILMFTSIGQKSVLYPVGFCKFFDCSILIHPYTHRIFFSFAVLLVLFYILEKWMPVITFLMFLLSLILFTLEESNGILNRNGMCTMAFFAQFVAYIRNNENLKKERIQLPIQVIAAGYTLAGISKLKESGFAWISESPQVSLQILKNYYYHYFDTGAVFYEQKGIALSNFVIKNQFFIKTLFTFSLFLELFVVVAIRNKISAFFYGLLFLSMHMGIYYLMDIIIWSIFAPMLIFFINPYYLLYLLGTRFFTFVRSYFFTKQLSHDKKD